MFSDNKGDGFRQGRPLPLPPTFSHIDDAPAAAVAAAAAAVAAATSITCLFILFRLFIRRIFPLPDFVGSLISAYNEFRPLAPRFQPHPSPTSLPDDKMPSSFRRPRLLGRKRRQCHCRISTASTYVGTLFIFLFLPSSRGCICI